MSSPAPPPAPAPSVKRSSTSRAFLGISELGPGCCLATFPAASPAFLLFFPFPACSFASLVVSDKRPPLGPLEPGFVCFVLPPPGGGDLLRVPGKALQSPHLRLGSL
jgi:hypothetical protein